MRNSKRKPRQRPSKKTETIRVPVEFKAQLVDFVDRRGMTTAGAFRVHGPSILTLIRAAEGTAQPAA